jgi:hypothetical protein
MRLPAIGLIIAALVSAYAVVAGELSRQAPE